MIFMPYYTIDSGMISPVNLYYRLIRHSLFSLFGERIEIRSETHVLFLLNPHIEVELFHIPFLAFLATAGAVIPIEGVEGPPFHLDGYQFPTDTFCGDNLRSILWASCGDFPFIPRINTFDKGLHYFVCFFRSFIWIPSTFYVSRDANA